MTESPNKQGRLCTVAEYLRYEHDARERHEYRDGLILLRASGNFLHSLVAASVIGELGNALKGRPHRAFESNLRVCIPRASFYTYPDVGVLTGEPQFDPNDPHHETITNPQVIVEVLSPETEAYDRGEKFTRYRLLDSLKEYVLVSQDGPSVEIFLRQDGGTWLLNPVAGLDAVAHFESIQVAIPLNEIYANVTFPPSTEPTSGAV